MPAPRQAARPTPRPATAVHHAPALNTSARAAHRQAADPPQVVAAAAVSADRHRAVPAQAGRHRAAATATAVPVAAVAAEATAVAAAAVAAAAEVTAAVQAATAAAVEVAAVEDDNNQNLSKLNQKGLSLPKIVLFQS